MLARAVAIQSSSILPFLDEDEVSRILLVDEQVIGDAALFLTGQFDQLAVERQYDLHSVGLDEILGDDLQRGVILRIATGAALRVSDRSDKRRSG